MIWTVEVFNSRGEPLYDAAREIRDLGICGEVTVYHKKLFFIEADDLEPTVTRITRELLIDPLLDSYHITPGFFKAPVQDQELFITYNPGVCDPVASSLMKAARNLGLAVSDARTGRYYRIEGPDPQTIAWIARKIFYNPLIEHTLDYQKMKKVVSLNEFSGMRYVFKRIEVNILDADDDELAAISKSGNLSLTLDEMRRIQEYFSGKGRNPTDCELETCAQTWSEHCAHKTFRGTIEYEERDKEKGTVNRETINNLLKSTVMRATKELAHPGCVSVFGDNSGVVRFDEQYNVCFKVETHNHPSSLEPFGGASTGIGGVIRDILGTGSAARPVASIDVFCFSPWHISHEQLPEGILHPRRVIKGVVGGVRDYGNKMGIPTISGAVCFDKRFLGNPLVYCGTVGILPKEKSFKRVDEGDIIVVCGARTGRDGIHGATFSSVELNEDTVALRSAVQIGNPIEEKKLTEAVLRARDEDLFGAITDCGAGGLSSAVGELASEWGCQVMLDTVPTKYEGLSYTEIWISESQERMVFFTKEKHLARLQEIFDEEEVEMTVIGKTTKDKMLRLFYGSHEVACIDMDFLHSIPRFSKRALWEIRKEKDVKLQEKDDYSDDLKVLLARPNIAPKDWIVRQYDHEVQGHSVLKPILGVERTGLQDASVIRPDYESEKSLVVGVGINPAYSDIDPYWMAALAIDEALRNVVSSGGVLSNTFILDNFSWGSPNDERLLGGLVRAARACYDFATYFGVPFISGKDSLYNEYTVKDERIAIPGTLLVSAISVIDSFSRTQTAALKKEGNLIYLVGETKSHMGASEYFRSLAIQGGVVPRVDTSCAKTVLSVVAAAVGGGYTASCHDCSEGGLAVALSEMCVASGRGACVFLDEVASGGELLDYEKLFSETPSRFVVEVPKEKQGEFESLLQKVPWGLLGCVSADSSLVFFGSGGKEKIRIDVNTLYREGLRAFAEFRSDPDREPVEQTG